MKTNFYSLGVTRREIPSLHEALFVAFAGSGAEASTFRLQWIGGAGWKSPRLRPDALESVRLCAEGAPHSDRISFYRRCARIVAMPQLSMSRRLNRETRRLHRVLLLPFSLVLGIPSAGTGLPISSLPNE